jgi:fructose/tagatose bisphosphate aldolase
VKAEESGLTDPAEAARLVKAEESGLTDPAEAARFVKATGVDLLAISVGNVHILLSGSRALDIDHLARVRREVDVPFDLHGGTGIAAASLREAIGLGVAKVCYGTYIKQRYLLDLRKGLERADSNPHKVLGFGGPEDLLVTGRRAVKEAVLERIEWLGCCGKA